MAGKRGLCGLTLGLVEDGPRNLGGLLRLATAARVLVPHLRLIRAASSRHGVSLRDAGSWEAGPQRAQARYRQDRHPGDRALSHLRRALLWIRDHGVHVRTDKELDGALALYLEHILHIILCVLTTECPVSH